MKRVSTLSEAEESLESLEAKVAVLKKKQLLRKLGLLGVPFPEPPYQPASCREIKTEILGHEVTIYDDQNSKGIDHMLREFQRDAYGIKSLHLREGDVVIDVGANVGLFSILVSKMYPGIRVYALEPAPRSFDFLRWNLVTNGLPSVTAINRGLTRDGRKLRIIYDSGNPGGSSAFKPDHEGVEAFVETATLDDVLTAFDIKEVACLLIDCEGCEHEVLPSRDLRSIKVIQGEGHNQNPNMITPETSQMKCLGKALSGSGFFTCPTPSS